MAVAAARTLFLRHGYAGATMEDIAGLAGLSRRTLFNIYGDKETLFLEIVSDVIGYAERFAGALSTELAGIRVTDVSRSLQGIGQRLARGILRPEVVALRRLLIREAGTFPELAADYFERAPGRVMDALASGFEHLARAGALRIGDPRRAAGQFAYLVAGAPLDRAMLLGTTPGEAEIDAGARAGVETFLAAYAVTGRVRDSP